MTGEKRYSYNKFRKGLLFLLFLWFLYGYIKIFSTLFQILQTRSFGEDVSTISTFLSLVFFGFWLAFYSVFPIMMGIVIPDVRVVDTGLFVQIFFFWWIFVPWEDALEVKLRRRNFVLHREAAIVLVRKLTPFHWLTGARVSGRLRPGFRIDHSIRDYGELVDALQEKMENL